MSSRSRAAEPAVAAHPGGRRFEVSIAASADESMARLEQLAGIWNGDFAREGSARGRLTLPVRAGVRRGFVHGPVSLRGSSPCRLRFDVEDRLDRVQYAAFLFLLLGALGGALTLLIPWVPRLLPLLPVGVILAVGAWLFIVARLTNSGPEEFFAELGALEPGGPEPPGSAE